MVDAKKPNKSDKIENEELEKNDQLEIKPYERPQSYNNEYMRSFVPKRLKNLVKRIKGKDGEIQRLGDGDAGEAGSEVGTTSPLMIPKK